LDSKIDVAVIETPPSFHPEQAAAAVDAGKHVFLAKPIAVDVPGCVSIADSGKKATQKKQAFLVDFQTRADPFFREALKRVHAGDIGDVVSIYSYYPQGGMIHDAPLTDKDSYLRLWYQSLELCGCCIVEQDIHTLDVASWIVGKEPLWAAGTGGRQRQYGTSNDYYTAMYGFDGNITLSFQSVKVSPGVKDEIITRAWGTGGVLETNYFGDVYILGNKPYEGGNCADQYWAGTVTNVKEFYEAIASGDFSNPTVAPSVRSNLTCILGRDAVRQRKLLEWNEMMQANERLEMNLDGLKS
jgi:predicted dehydrogenase